MIAVFNFNMAFTWCFVSAVIAIAAVKIAKAANNDD